jgi:hypothetical protein
MIVSMPASLEASLHRRKKNLQAQSDIPIPILVIAFKHIRHALQTNASLHEQVETQSLLLASSSSRGFGVSVEKQLDKSRTQAVSKRHQRICELLVTDTAAPVCVETIEQTTPCCEEAPQAAELFEVDGASAVGVEHADHHFDGVWVESCVVAVDESAAELILGKLA